MIREHLRLSREPLRLPGDEKKLAQEIKAWGASLVIIDNLTRVMVGDPNSTKDAAAFTKAWCQVCEDSGASVLPLHHTRKTTATDDKSDPFDALRGSGDFGAAARNILVSRPLRKDGEALSEVRVRGNLDLRRDAFVIGFEREQRDGRWFAQLADRGDPQTVKADAAKKHREANAAKRKTEHAAEFERRRLRALEIVRREGSVTQDRLASEFDLSARAVAPVFASLEAAGVLRMERSKGYVLAEPEDE
jgi:RecA-family ATPase